MNFSQALDLIKEGKKLSCKGWNGKDMFVYLVHGSVFEVNRAPLNSMFELGTKITYHPHIDIKYADGTCGVWLASMKDLMSDEWEVI